MNLVPITLCAPVLVHCPQEALAGLGRMGGLEDAWIRSRSAVQVSTYIYVCIHRNRQTTEPRGAASPGDIPPAVFSNAAQQHQPQPFPQQRGINTTFQLLQPLRSPRFSPQAWTEQWPPRQGGQRDSQNSAYLVPIVIPRTPLVVVAEVSSAW